ncbi:hypothetical protein Mterra_00188 [Calidithermus terrae]|uniref:Uncharacterized protein n=1 Tax=Calidithermus terrae TaxID=1408545 RepID=A0A399F1R0_9DEIN|nr:hypothetical protein [Calidithermus terrae]RIH90694.1 hypothetical protein Mterra_00188 [Calidithermus terrae]
MYRPPAAGGGGVPKGIVPAFTGDAGKRQAWRAFLSRITQEELGLEEAVETVWAFLGPVVRGEAGGSWDPQGQRWEK